MKTLPIPSRTLTFSGITPDKKEAQALIKIDRHNPTQDEVVFQQPTVQHSTPLRNRLIQIADDIVGKLKTFITREPALNLYTEENPFVAKVEAVKSLYPPQSDPKKSQFFEIDLNLEGSRYVNDKAAEPHLKLYPGHHVAIAPNDKKISEDDYRYMRWYSTGPYKGKILKLLISRVPVESIQGRTPDQFSLSNYLAGLKPGDKLQMFGPHSNLKLQTHKASDNVVMISAGVAIISHLGAVRDRAKQIAEHPNGKVGKTWLLTGYRTAEQALYDQELKSYPFLDYHVATSRQDPKKYVQQLAEEHAAEILPLIYKNNTYVHLCGFETMGKDLTNALIKTVEASAPVEERLERVQKLKDRIEFLKKQGRWTEDWGR